VDTFLSAAATAYVSSHICVQPYMCPAIYVSSHICVQPYMCPAIYVSSHICVQPYMCPAIYVSSHICVQPYNDNGSCACESWADAYRNDPLFTEAMKNIILQFCKFVEAAFVLKLRAMGLKYWVFPVEWLGLHRRNPTCQQKLSNSFLILYCVVIGKPNQLVR